MVIWSQEDIDKLLMLYPAIHQSTYYTSDRFFMHVYDKYMIVKHNDSQEYVVMAQGISVSFEQIERIFKLKAFW